MSFINPFFLFALATAALPVLYHLVRRIQARQVPFSSLMFLKMTPREVVRRRRIQHWLLMLMRCGILALLALAFARPFIPEDQIPFVSQRENQSVVLLVDNSFSMQYASSSAESFLDVARREALDKLGEAAENDEFAVVVFSDEVRQLTPLDTDLALHRNALQDALEPSYRITDFYKPMRLAEEILESAEHRVRRIVLISDIQQTGWQGAFENWKLDPSIDFEIVPVGQEGRENSFIEAFSLSERRVEDGVVHRFNARVSAGLDAGLPLNTIGLELDGSRVDEKRVGGDEVRNAFFQYRAPREGVFQGEIRLEEDNLLADDVRYFTFSVEERPALLGVGGTARELTSAAYYLERAFNQGDRALFAFDAVAGDGISGSTLRGRRMAFLFASTLTPGDAQVITRYVEEGGSVLVAFDEQVNLPSYSGLLAELGVGRAEEIVRARSEQGYDSIIGEVDTRHPIFSIFAETGSGAIFRPRFRQYVRLEPDTSAQVLGRYDSGDPFLVEAERGKGRVLVYTSSLSPSWTDFTINELYVPFLYQLVKYTLSADASRQEYRVGDVVELDGRPGSEWDVRAPGDIVYKVPIDETGTGFFREANVPGHYTAAHEGAQLFFSVNVDPQESLLASRDAEEAYGAVVPPPEDVPLTVEEARLMELDDEERQQKFWRYVILLMVVLYALETFLANRKQKS